MEVRETNYDIIHDAQEHFRELMTALSRPGTVHQVNKTITLPNELGIGAALIGLSLLNDDVCFYTDRNKEGIASFFRVNTNTEPVIAEEANFLFLDGDKYCEAIEGVKVGEPAYPENSAFIILDVELLDKEPLSRSVLLEIQGPGVKSTERVFVRGLLPEYLKALGELNIEYPLGVDTFLADKDGRILGLPRTSQLSWKTIN